MLLAKLESRHTSVSTDAPFLGAGAPTPVVPSWKFVGLSGNYFVDCSSNLANPQWRTIAQVYSVTNITITSDTVQKRNLLFYRVRPSP